ncbi:MAG: ABC transporter permease [Oscillospiraceae bacterium]
MVRYVIKRLLIAIPVVVCVAFLIFTLMYFVPGDPTTAILGNNATPEEIASLRDHLGLDDPYIVRLGRFMRQVFIEFDLGTSWIYQTNISSEIANRLPITLGIALFSLVISAVLGIPLGIWAAVNQDRWQDKTVLVSSSILRCLPNFWVGLMLMLLFCLKMDWLPSFYVAGAGLRNYILPCITIMLGSFSWTSRQMRSSMLEVIRSDYVTAARAQGFSKNSVYYQHALPNALIPIITILGNQFAMNLGGTIIIETIFSIPGMGTYIQAGINQRDTPIVTGCIVFLAIAFCLVMLAVDLLYAFADPRIRAKYEQQAAPKGVRAQRRGGKRHEV